MIDKINLFGSLEVESNGRPADILKSAQGCALLSYLLITRQRHSRESIAALLWAGPSTADTLRFLRKLLYRVGPLLPDLEVTRQRLAYRAGAGTVVDLYVLEAGLAGQGMERLDEALQTYRGDLLAGFYLEDATGFSEWLAVERERLRHRVRDGFRRLCSWCEETNAWSRGIGVARRWLALDLYDEEVHRVLMRFLVADGQVMAAKQQYQVCRRLLWDELGVEPEPATVDLYEQIQAAGLEPGKAAAPALVIGNRQAWGEAPSTELFFGRQAEMEQIGHWITTEPAHLIAILGIGGQGKTTLAAKTARVHAGQYATVYWRSLINAPPVEMLLDDYLSFLSQNQGAPPEGIPAKIAAIRGYLQREPHLLVLDNLETVLDAARAGYFRSDYEEFEQVLHLFANGGHQSTLMVTSRELPLVLGRHDGADGRVKTMALAGLSADAGADMLATKQIALNTNTVTALTQRYSGNPLALQLVAQTVEEFYFGDGEAFLAAETFMFEDIRDVLARQIGRLTEPEQEILFWLAVARVPMAPYDLQARLIQKRSQREIVEALQALRRRSLLERTARGFVLQNVISEYLSERLIEAICRELTPAARSAAERRMAVTNRFALLDMGEQEYIRQSQRRLFLDPIGRYLLDRAPLAVIRESIRDRLAGLRAATDLPAGYAAGNLLNLLLHVHVDITGFDFSDLSVWQGDAQGHFLRSVNFSGADLSHTRFSDAFGFVWSVACSPDGRYFGAGTSDGKIRLWLMDSAQPVAVWRAHSSTVYTLDFSPDGQLLASGSADGMIHLWAIGDITSVQNPTPHAVLRGHRGAVEQVVFSPEPGQPKLVSASDDRTLRVWDLSRGEVQHILKGHTNFVVAAAISPDGRLLASGGRDRTLRLWDMADGRQQRVIQVHDGWVTGVDFDSSGKRLASASEDGTVRIWDVDQLAQPFPVEVTPTRTLGGDQGGIQTIVFHPDGETLAGGGNDMAVRIWDTRTGTLQFLLMGHTNWVRALAFGPDGHVLLSGSWDHTVRLWDMESGQAIRAIQGYAPHSFGIAFTQDGATLISGNSDQTVTEWDVATGQIRQTLHGHHGFVWRVAVSPDDALLASAGYDKSVRLWERKSGRSMLQLPLPRGTVQPLAFSPDGILLVSGDEDGAILAWQISSESGKYDAQLVRCLDERSNGHENWIISTCFSPDGRILASSSADHTIKLWDVASWTLLRTLSGHSSGIQEVVFSPDGQLLASAGWDSTARLWRVADGEMIHILQGHTDVLQGIAFSPDGRTLATAGYDQTVRLWDVASGRERAILRGHTMWIFYLAYSPDGQLLASSSSDGAIKLWDPATGACLQSWHIPGPYAGMNLWGATGITPAQRAALIALGAREAAG